MSYQKEWVDWNSDRWEMLNGNCSSIALTMARKMLIKSSGEHNPFLNPNGYDSSYCWEVHGACFNQLQSYLDGSENRV